MRQKHRHAPTTIIAWILNGISLGMLLIGFLFIFINWSSLHKSESMESLALTLIGAVVWFAFTFIERSPENINLPIFLHKNRQQNIIYNLIVTNVLKNALVLGLLLFSWMD